MVSSSRPSCPLPLPSAPPSLLVPLPPRPLFLLVSPLVPRALPPSLAYLATLPPWSPRLLPCCRSATLPRRKLFILPCRCSPTSGATCSPQPSEPWTYTPTSYVFLAAHPFVGGNCCKDGIATLGIFFFGLLGLLDFCPSGPSTSGLLYLGTLRRLLDFI